MSSLKVAVLSTTTGIVFLFAAPITRLIRHCGMGVVTRIMGLVLTAIAIGMLTEGLKRLLPGLA